MALQWLQKVQCGSLATDEQLTIFFYLLKLVNWSLVGSCIEPEHLIDNSNIYCVFR